MIAIVRTALRRPYTFVVLALLILIVGPLAALRTPVDIFPDIRIPVIAVIWQYTSLQPDQMAGRMTTQFQRALTTTVNDIEHIEANSYTGLSITKVFFQPAVDILDYDGASSGDFAIGYDLTTAYVLHDSGKEAAFECSVDSQFDVLTFFATRGNDQIDGVVEGPVERIRFQNCMRIQTAHNRIGDDAVLITVSIA